MAYNRIASSGETFAGSSPDTMITPKALKENVWYFDGNSLSASRSIGTTSDHDIPVIRNGSRKVLVDNTTWTTSSFISALTVGNPTGSTALRFPVQSDIQHGIVSSGGSLSFVVANGSGNTATPFFAVQISPTGNIGINKISPSTPLHISGITTQENTDILQQTSLGANTDVDTGMEVIATVPISGSAAIFEYVIYNSTKGSMRAGIIQAVWNASSIKYQEVSTTDIGDTSGVTLSITNDTTIICLKANVTSDNWTIKAAARTIL